MEGKHLIGLMEAYSEVYAPQENIEEIEQLGEAVGDVINTKTPYGMHRTVVTPTGTRSTLNGRELDREVKRDPKSEVSAKRGSKEKPATKKDSRYEEFEYDIFDLVIEFLQVEGFAETLEEAEWLMANVIDEEAIEIILGEEQLNELSLKTKISAAARRGTNDFEGREDGTTKSGKSKFDQTLRSIERTHGSSAAKHAVAATNAETFGRTDPRTGKRQERAKPRIEKNRTYRTTKSGKMHGQDQNALKRSLQYNRSSRNEEYVNEAQHARENPEKYEREQDKKYAPVRGEKTPMPPRGNKRREDFEKWYAANVR